MCVYSAVMDYVRQDMHRYIPPSWPVILPQPFTITPFPITTPCPLPLPSAPVYPDPVLTPAPSIPAEHVRALEELLRKAKEYDRITGQPDCELDDKKETLRKLAEQLGVKIELP